MTETRSRWLARLRALSTGQPFPGKIEFNDGNQILVSFRINEDYAGDRWLARPSDQTSEKWTARYPVGSQILSTPQVAYFLTDVAL
jgi:hypothetical protein